MLSTLPLENIQAIFIDRDGTIGGDNTVHYPGEFSLFPFTEKIIEILKEKNIKILSFTNQPGISRGEASKEDFIKELEAFGFDGIYICPHSHTDGCSCRKPGTGMLLKAADDHNLDLTKCVVIGDRWTDIVAGSKVKTKTILVQTGAGQEALNEHREKWEDIDPNYIAEDLNDGINWLLNK
ncbi:HAD-IIIA family hydrolase [Priestia megaterium]|uniref:HAD-IIIA family hydrolase n=1 Tax=Priestia megaterium TaxID=1404 RepID=UPI003D07C653